MNHDCIKVLEDRLLPFGESHYGGNFIFQQDNATIQVTKSFSQSKNLQVMNCPAYSLGLNPIENVWGMLSRLVYNNRRQFHSKSNLEKPGKIETL